MPQDKRVELLGYRFQNPTLLDSALTHPSASLRPGETHNQRLEFLGDAVLELCVSLALYVRCPEANEGLLTRLRSDYVREETLCAAARQLQLGSLIRMAPGEILQNGNEKPSVLADCFEAVVAAIYLDGGLIPAQDFVARTLNQFESPPCEELTNYKSVLQEKLQSQGLPTPQYQIVENYGPPHAPWFVAVVQCGNKRLGRGRGRSKKEAERQAARVALLQEESVAPEET